MTVLTWRWSTMTEVTTQDATLAPELEPGFPLANPP
jgi:hypothetical protein